MASPNYIPGILDGSTAPGAIVGSSKITSLFANFFKDTLDKPYSFSGMSGGSDYYPFVESNKPAGGLAAGAGSIKSPEERKEFGGLANAPYDPCYHLSCDTTENINMDALEMNGQAAAEVLQWLADKKDVRKWLEE